MSLAALRELRCLFPNHHLGLMVKPWVADLFEGQELVDETIIIHDESSTIRRVTKARAHMRSFESVVLFQNAFEAALTAWLAGVPNRIGYDTHGRQILLNFQAKSRVKKLNRHQIYNYLDLLYQTGLSSHDYLSDSNFQPDIHLRITSRANREAEQLLRQFGISSQSTLIIINPGAHFGPAKRWPSERYAALADRLSKKQTEIIIIGSTHETVIAEEIRRLMRHPPKILTGVTSLSGLMGLLSRCELFLTNDSGPMHLAAALDVPQIALFGSTDDIATGPFSSKAKVIHKHVECSPCLLRKCPIDLRCSYRIDVDEVFEAAQSMLGR